MKKIFNLFKNTSHGITLIALIVTIIVLMILAGITLAGVLGENGIINMALKAKQTHENAVLQESIAIENLDFSSTSILSGLNVEKVTDKAPGVLEEVDGKFIINSIEDLVAFSNSVNSENTYQNKTVELGLTLDFNSELSYVDPSNTSLFGDYNKDSFVSGIQEELTDENGNGFIPIGYKYEQDGDGNFTGTQFLGTFNGNNLGIKNIPIYDNTLATIGLFGCNSGKIENLIISGSMFIKELASPSNLYLGGITAYNLSSRTDF